MEPLTTYLTKEGWKRDFDKTLDHVCDFLSKILINDEPRYEPVHRTYLERQWGHSNRVRRELIQFGMEPNLADYEARRRVGLTR